jgi:hypothetical protein
MAIQVSAADAAIDPRAALVALVRKTEHLSALLDVLTGEDSMRGVSDNTRCGVMFLLHELAVEVEGLAKSAERRAVPVAGMAA